MQQQDDGTPGTRAALIYEILSARSGVSDYGAPPRTLLAALPGSYYSNEFPQIASDALVEGIVEDVQAGVSYFVGSDGRDHRVEAGAGDVQELVVTLDVGEVICSTTEVPDVVTFGFWVNGSSQVEELRDEFENAGPLAVFLSESGVTSVPAYDMTMVELLSVAGPDGELAWPVATDSFGARWVRGADSVSTLRDSCDVSAAR